jgi:hypothetical protein
MRSHCRLCVVESLLPVNALMPEPVFLKRGRCIMAPETISAAYFINRSHQCVCVCMPPIVARQSLGKVFPSFRSGAVARRTRSRTNEYTQCCTRVCGSACVAPQSLLDNNWVKQFPRQRKIVGGGVLHADHAYQTISFTQNFLFYISIFALQSRKILSPVAESSSAGHELSKFRECFPS